MTNEPVRRALRRPAAQRRERDHPARDGPRALDPGGDRGDRAAHGAPRARGDRRAQPLPGRRRGAQLRGQRPAAARGAVRRHLDPAGGRRRRRRGRRGARLRSGHVGSKGAAAPGRARAAGGDGMQGAFLGPEFPRRRDRGLPRRPRLSRTAGWRRRSGRRTSRGGSPPSRTWSASSRGAWSSARARSATARSSATPRSPRDAVGDEPQDQVPRVLPALRAGLLRGARRATSSSSTARRPTCCWWRRCRRARVCRSRRDEPRPAARRVDQPAALRHAGDHPRGLLGARPDRVARATSRASTT